MERADPSSTVVMRAIPAVVLACLVPFIPAEAENHAVGVRAGLLGAGLEYSYRFSEKLSLRGALNGSDYSYDATESGVDYEVTADFDSMSVGIDYHPARGPFRLTAGLLKNDSMLRAISSAGQNVTLAGTTYSADEIGTLSGDVRFDDMAPQVGVGWAWLQDRKIGVSLDLGVLSQGTPTVTLYADPQIDADPDFLAEFLGDLAAEEAELQAELDDLDVYPYITLGIVFRF